MVKRVVVGAHYGALDWAAQRLTALVMALYTVYFVINLLLLPAYDNAAWRVFFAGGFARFATFLFFVALFYHAWIGVRDIFMDYINNAGVRLLLHTMAIFALIGYAGWAAQILWRL